MNLTNLVDKLAIAEHLAALDPHVWYDLAEGFSCAEAEVLADFLRAFVDDQTADSFLESHADGDDEGDMHEVVLDERGRPDGYRLREDAED